MPMDEHFRKLERMYEAAPINRLYEPSLEVARGRALLTMAARPEHFHAAGALHGSVCFKALDDAAFFAAASLIEDVFVVTASFHVHFLRPVTGGLLRAEGRVVSAARNLIVAESRVEDGSGREVARGSGSFVRSRTRLSDIETYR